MIVFDSLKAAIDAGFQIYDRTATGYLVRIRTPRGWALAIVDVCRHAGAAQ
jgi:hypothetical protein